MTDEEKEALRNFKSEYETCDHYSSDLIIELDDAEIILNLIEKQSKEIEHQIEKRANQRNELAILNAKQIEFNKLVNTVNSYKGQFKRQQKEIEELKEVKWYYEISRIPKDKIKAKIEVLDKQEEDLQNSISDEEREEYSDASISWELMDIHTRREVLQSLLEKE